MQARILRSTITLCLPNIGWLEKYVREHRVKYRIHMFDRTSAMLQRSVVNWRTGTGRFEDLGVLSGIPSARKVWPDLWNAYESRKISAVRDMVQGGAQAHEDRQAHEQHLAERRRKRWSRTAEQATTPPSPPTSA